MLSQPAAAAAAAAAASPSPSMCSAEELLQQRDAPLGVSNEAKAIHDSVDKLMKHMGQKVDLAAQRRMLGRLDMQETKTVLTAFSSVKKHFINRGKVDQMDGWMDGWMCCMCSVVFGIMVRIAWMRCWLRASWTRR